MELGSRRDEVRGRREGLRRKKSVKREIKKDFGGEMGNNRETGDGMGRDGREMASARNGYSMESI